MELKIIQKDTLLYRSYNNDSKRDGYWYALNKTDVLGYGNTLGEYRVVKELRLIDITSSNFYNILQDSLKNIAYINPEIKKIAHTILYPLGFDDIVFYRTFTASLGIDITSYPLVPSVHTESQLFFNGRSRLSIHTYDVEFMKHLHIIFGSICDGIISEKMFPDIIRNGFQCAELSVFDNSVIEFVKEIPRHTLGGTMEGKVLPQIDTSKLSPYFWETVKLADEILSNIDTSKIKMPNIVIHESHLSNSIVAPNYINRRKTRKNRRNLTNTVV